MCGIAGLAAARPDPRAEAIVRGMSSRLRHRGPDRSGFYCGDQVCLGHRRLSIIDLDRGHQPMANESGSLWITYNGEIFNHAALRTQLERAGHCYSTRSDTETILHAYEEYGARCVTRLRGFFAFAVWDNQKKTLFCARDRLGIKPFYYFWNGRLFAFASEIKALFEHPSISPEFEESLLGEYLGFGYTSGENTLFRGIRKLMPGHALRLDLRGARPELAIERYWEVPEQAENRQNAACASDQEWISETRRRLEETVQMRLMSDVPLGVFLSGGIDSSLIAALASRHLKSPVKTFSVGYREAEFSELAYAAEVAGALGADHHATLIGRNDFFDALPKLIWHEDEPLAWPSSVSLYFVSKLASEHVKVVLTGEGSDELFGGYERYRWNLLNCKYGRLYELLPHGLRSRVRQALAATRLIDASIRRKIGHTFIGRDSSLESLFLDNFLCAFSTADQDRLLQAGAAPIYASYLSYWNSRTSDRLLPRMLFADQKTYLVELLMKQDQMSMACSIESRVPFLDHQFVEFAMGIPDRLKIRGRVQKYVLKKAAEGLLPDRIIHRKKAGFPTPLRHWMRGPGAEPLHRALRAKDGLLGAYVDPDELDRLVHSHSTGRADATDRLWRLLNLQIWGDIFLTGKNHRWQEIGGPLETAASL